jgi:hypothetical protein
MQQPEGKERILLKYRSSASFGQVSFAMYDTA